MRLPITSFFLIAAALLGDFQAGSAQSPTSRSGRSSANNCYFTSKEQCQRTISGIGAFCLTNPYYRPSSRGRARTR
jgi:Protein of unknown function (DUF3551)